MINLYVMKLTSQSGEKTQMVENFTYFDSTLPCSANLSVEFNKKMAKDSSGFECLRKTAWGRNPPRCVPKLKVYRAVVLTTLPYDYETRIRSLQAACKKLNHFSLKCLRTLLRICLQYEIPETEDQHPSIVTLIRKAQIRWAVHVTRMSDDVWVGLNYKL